LSEAKNPEYMRAAVITQPGEPDVLRVEMVERPSPTADQIRVRVHAAGLNRADLLQRQGGYPAPAGAPSTIPGLEIAGEVDAVGPLVQRLKPGDRVFGIVGGGAHAEYVVTSEDLVARIPDRLDDIAAGGVPEVFMTAFDALFMQAGLTLGERVLVHAAGSGVGTASVQLAAAAGATVWGTTRTPDKHQQIIDLGAQAVFSGPKFVDGIRAATNGDGVDVVLDFVGAPYLAANLEVLAQRGRMVVVGLMGGAETSIDLGVLMRKRLRLFGTVLRSRSRAEKAALTARFATAVVPLLASGVIEPIIDRVFPLDAIADAHRYMQSNANVGKIILQVAQGM
jgi:NADPH:quinone reductase